MDKCTQYAVYLEAQKLNARNSRGHGIHRPMTLAHIVVLGMVFIASIIYYVVTTFL